MDKSKPSFVCKDTLKAMEIMRISADQFGKKIVNPSALS